MKCEKCGTEYEGNFCTNCGETVNTTSNSQPSAQPGGTICPKCGIVYQGNFCPNGCNSAASPKKKKSKAGIIVAVIAVVLVIGIIGAAFGDKTEPTSGSVNENSAASAQLTEGGATKADNKTNSSDPSSDVSSSYSVGDILDAKGLKIHCQKAEKWESDNQFMQPEDGKMFIRVYFSIENVSGADKTVTSYDFDCYADGVQCDTSWYGDNQLSFSTISNGRKTEGYIYYQIPENSQQIEIEYETSWWTGKKAIFNIELS